MSDIELLADKIVMIDHGKMIFEGDTLDLKEIYGDGTLEEIVKTYIVEVISNEKIKNMFLL